MADELLVVTFEGNQTIEKAESVKETLLKTLKTRKKEILLNLSKIEKVDHSFLQLLHAAAVEAESKKKVLSLTGSVPEVLIEAVKLSGFDKNLIGVPGKVFEEILKGGDEA